MLVAEPGLVERVLEQAVYKTDMDFIKYLVTEQGVAVKGKSLITKVISWGKRNRPVASSVCQGASEYATMYSY